MNTRRLTILMCCLAFTTWPCSGMTPQLRTLQPIPVPSHAPCPISVTWRGHAGEDPVTGPVDLLFTDNNSGQTWIDRHFPPEHPHPDTSRDGSLSYTIPVFLPFHKKPATWSVSVITAGTTYSDLMLLPVAATSVFQRTVNPEPVFGWRNLSDSGNREVTGFYSRECPGPDTDCWIWMSRRGTVVIPNPMTGMTLTLTGWIPEHLAPGLHLHLNDREPVFVMPVDHHITVNHHIPFDQTGFGEYLVVTLETADAFTPADDGVSTDSRELGMMVKTFQIQLDTTPPGTGFFFDLLETADRDRDRWRMADKGRLRFPNPGKDMEIFMKCHIPETVTVPGIRVGILINGQRAGTVIPPGGTFALWYHLSMECISGSDTVDLDVVLEYPFPLVFPGAFFRPPGMTVSRLWVNG